MTIQNTENKDAYEAGVSQTIFPFTFRVDRTQDFEVWLDEEEQVYGSSYAIDDEANLGNPNGGNIVFVSAPDQYVRVTIMRVVILDQLVDYHAYDPFPAETHEFALDKGIMIDQQFNERVGRTIEYPTYEESLETNLLPPYEAGLGLGWDLIDRKLANYGITLSGTPMGALPVISASNYTTLNQAVAAIGATPANLVFDKTLQVVSNLETPKTLNLWLPTPGYFIQDEAVGNADLTILGALICDSQKAFDWGNGTGRLLFGSRIPVVNPLWLGAFGDEGVTDDAAVMQVVVDTLTGKQTLDLQGMFYRIDSEVTVNVSDITIRNGKIISDGIVFRTRNALRVAPWTVLGLSDPISITVALLIGTETVTVASTATLSAGDYVQISSTKIWETLSNCTQGEFVKIKDIVDGTHFTLEQAAVDTYELIDSPVIKLFNPIKNIVYEDLVAIGPGPTSSVVFCRFDYCQNVKVHRCTIENFGTAAIHFANTILSSAVDNNLSGANRSGYGYGVYVQSSQGILVTNNHVGRCTHAIVTGGAEAGWIPGRFHNFSDNIISGTTKAMINAHGPTEYVMIANNVARFPEASVNANGIEVFAPNVTIVGNIIDDPIEHGIVCTTHAIGSAGVQNFIIANNTINNKIPTGSFDGIRIKPSVGVSVKCTITGNRIKSPRIGVLLEASIVGTEIFESIIANNSIEVGDDGVQINTENTGDNIHNISITGNTMKGAGTADAVYIAGAASTNSLAAMIQITGNTFRDFLNGVRSISSMVRDIGITGNVFDNITGQWVDLPSRAFMISGSTPSEETIEAGSPALNPYVEVSVLDSSGGAITGTLGNSGMRRGFMKTIIMTDATNLSTISINNHETSDPEVAQFDAKDEMLTLMWTNDEWVTIKATCTFP